MSAGSFGTPLLLQQSGIGDTADLSPLGISTVVSNPSVGKNMSDHTLLVNTFEVNTTGSFDTIFASGDLLNQYIGQWQSSKTGPLVDSLSNHLGWLRLPASASIFKTTPDPAAGPKSSHYEILFSVGIILIPSTSYSSNAFSLAECMGSTRVYCTCREDFHEHQYRFDLADIP